jgi:hypothetical protein
MAQQPPACMHGRGACRWFETGRVHIVTMHIVPHTPSIAVCDTEDDKDPLHQCWAVGHAEVLLSKQIGTVSGAQHGQAVLCSAPKLLNTPQSHLMAAVTCDKLAHAKDTNTTKRSSTPVVGRRFHAAALMEVAC